MPAITSLDLENAKLDVDHIAAIANSESLTATDRLGSTKATMKGAVIAIESKVSDVESAKVSALDSIPAILASIPDKGVVGFETRVVLFADLGHLPGTIAFVTNDPTSEYNATYRKVGASGSGSWVQATFQEATKEDIELLQSQQDSSAENIALLELAQEATNEIVTPLVETLGANVALHDDEGRKYSFVTGNETRMSFGILEKGGMRFKDTVVEQSTLGVDEDDAGRVAHKQLTDGFQFGPWKLQVNGTGLSIADGVGRTAFAITHSGKVVAPSLVISSDNPMIRSQTPFTAGNHRATDIKHIIVNGQSLSRGAATLTAISTVQPYSNITLAGGVLAVPHDVEYDASAFKPLVEENLSSVISTAESPTSAICNGVVRRIVGDGEAHQDWVFMGSSCGSSGQSVEQLSDGGNWIGGLKKVITDSSNLALSQGKSYSVWAHVLIQGEAQYVAEVNEEIKAKNPLRYTGKVNDLHESIAGHIMATTGQKFRPYLVTYQTGAHKKYAFDTMPIALAQWRSSKINDNVVMAVPVYIMPHAADALHLTNEGSWLMGEYISRAIYHTMYRAERKWKPLEPVKVTWNDTTVTIKFDVPFGELSLDNALCSLAPNFGFDIWHGNSLTSIISAVSVVAIDTVQITLSAPANADATLSYARGRPGDPLSGGPVTGPRGNLRDTHGYVDTAVSPLGNTFPLHNPCVMFEYHRQKGF